MQPHILIIDDDDRIRDLLSQYLKQNNFLISAVKNAEEAYEFLAVIHPDLIILDLMLPGESGFEFATNLKKKLDISILMLTALGGIEDRVKGLELGADDYLAKPFEPREILLRIKKILSWRKPILNLIKFGALEFDIMAGRLVDHNNNLISLTSTEQKLLKILIENHGKLMLRDDLAKLCGGVNERSIDVQITRLRNKIEVNPKNPFYLKTVRGEGYILNL